MRPLFTFPMPEAKAPQVKDRTDPLGGEVPPVSEATAVAAAPGKGKESRAGKRWISRFAFSGWLPFSLVVVSLMIGFWVGESNLWEITTHRDVSTPEQLAALPDGAKPLNPGPWGNLEALPMYLEPPEEYLPTRTLEAADRRWCFTGLSVAQLTSLFQSADLTGEQQSELLDASKWEVTQNAIYVNPSKELILSLSPQARKVIYGPMLAQPDNLYALLRCSYRADQFDDFFSNSGLPGETLSLIKTLSYPYGDLVIFCDAPTVLDTLPSPELKTRLMKTLLRKRTLLLRLHITPDTDINALSRYWSKAGQGVNIQPMLESLTKLPQGARMDVIELFPPLPSADLYSYPFPSTRPEDQHKDCHYTALNFFRDTPDPRFTDPKVVKQTLQNDYYPVLADPRYGDLIALVQQDGSIIHSCIFIADNVVYTKNSPNFRDPYILMTLPDMMDNFRAQIPEGQKLQVLIYRNKYY